LFTSCESWKRRQVVGIRNFCEGSGYGVFVVKTTGIDVSELIVEVGYVVYGLKAYFLLTRV
jgi:hypothetical protein